MAMAKGRHFVGAHLLGVVAALLGLTGRAEDPQLLEAPLNPAYVEYEARLAERGTVAAGEPGEALGFRPAPVDMSHLLAQVPQVRGGGQATRLLPTSFDWRTTNPSKLPPVRNQNPYGTCWAHATYASLESFLRTGESPDYSERHMVFTHGWDYGYNDGGHHVMSTAYLARWGGAINETDCPYSGMPTAPSGSYTVRKKLHEALFYASPSTSNTAAMDLVKEAIMANGALHVSYYHDNAYYNSTQRAYYCSGITTTNHAVSVIGWDDGFSAAKFGTTPPGNGAWIIRNSWGTSWGDGGYFYLSYYDSSFETCTPTLFTTTAETNTYNHVYQHDPLGWVSKLGIGSTVIHIANVFPLSNSEVIKAVGFYTVDRNVSYQVQVYRNLSTASSPISGTICGIGTSGSTAVTGTFVESGYHTVALPTPVLLTAPQNFSVVLKLTNSASVYPAAFEYAIAGRTSAATATANQSFYSSSGSSWTDLTSYSSTANFCIKAFTCDPVPEINLQGGSPLQSIPDGSTATSTADGTSFGTVNVGGNTSHTFTIQNLGNAALTLDGSPLVELVGGNPGDFSVSSMPSPPVTSGNSTSFSVTFSPSETGSRTTTVSISNNDSDESTYTFVIQGTGGIAPVATNDSYGTTRNVACSVDSPGVLTNDTDADGGTLTAAKASDPANGSVTLNADGSFTYTPDDDFAGTDTFTYRANDGALNSGLATVTISVSKSDQTISFAALAGETYGDAPFELEATATSSLAVSFSSSDEDVAT
ncbi:MAG: lectin like domain-containing protein, partial [Lentisphaeria bacterium]|nr:lectin like domain-containing protein [Lentisphaeria bacterium]